MARHTILALMIMPKISVLGSGVVGASIGKGLIDLGNSVAFYDVKDEPVKILRGRGYSATTSLDEAVKDSDLSFICVPTPTRRGGIDLKYIKSVVCDLSSCLKRRTEYHTVVIKSTVVPTTTRRIILPLLEKISKKKVGVELGLCVNPEFLTEISRSWTTDKSFERNFSNEERIVVGEYDKKSGDSLMSLFRTLDAPKFRTDLETAEMIKYASNCALAMKISYWNEIFFVCRRLDIDSKIVAQATILDSRIGEYGSVHGKAFGGKCLPKDLHAFIKFSEGLGYKPELLEAVERINERIKEETGVRE